MADDFRGPSSDDRKRWLEQIDEPDAHRAIVGDLECLWRVDAEPVSDEQSPTKWLRVVAWNIERGRDPAAIAALIERTGADVALLSEVDLGMARTGNRDVARDVARDLRMGSVWGIEYVELSLGKAADLVGIQAKENVRGLHGNAILSRTPVDAPEVVRLDEGGDWFTMSRGEPRVGGQMAVVGTTEMDGLAIELASVHLASHSDAEHRAVQLAALLDGIDERSAGPAIVGGDLNTFGATFLELADRNVARSLREAEPGRFSWPVGHEPLFDVAATHGYEWVDANVASPTTRHDGAGLPDHIPLKLDWILVRGLEARRPTVVPAVGSDGTPLSDHDLIGVSVRPAARTPE